MPDAAETVVRVQAARRVRERQTAQETGRRRDPIGLGKFMYEQGIEIAGIDYFAQRGYIVVVVNPRGIGNSEGIWTGVLSRQDQTDCCYKIHQKIEKSGGFLQ